MRPFLLRKLSVQTPAPTVIDANLLRDRDVVAEQLARYRSSGEQLLVADAVWNELITNSNWPSTLRASFGHIAAEPEALLASWSVTAMQAAERRDGVPAQNVVHRRMTDFLRRYIMDIDNPRSKAAEQLRAALAEHGVNEKRALGLRRKEATVRLVEGARSDIPRERLRHVGDRLRSRLVDGVTVAGDREPLKQLVVEAFNLEQVAGSLEAQGVDRKIARGLVSRPSVNSVRNLFLTHMAMEWTVLNGVENARVERVHNDYVDIEYAIVAWAAGGDYLTKDDRARQRYDDVIELCGRVWPEWSTR